MITPVIVTLGITPVNPTLVIDTVVIHHVVEENPPHPAVFQTRRKEEVLVAPRFTRGVEGGCFNRGRRNQPGFIHGLVTFHRRDEFGEKGALLLLFSLTSNNQLRVVCVAHVPVAFVKPGRVLRWYKQSVSVS